MKNMIALALIGACAGIAGCAPEVGSEAWCKKMDETPKGEWTMNATRDYTKYCVLKLEKDETE